jgi:hypothetical protein
VLDTLAWIGATRYRARRGSLQTTSWSCGRREHILGQPEATGRVAFANGASVTCRLRRHGWRTRQRDDDTWAFSLAEKLGGVSRDFIAAVACGMTYRPARACDTYSRLDDDGGVVRHPVVRLSVRVGDGGAAHAARCTADGNALGIAFNQMSGSRQMAVGEATHAPMQAGFSARDRCSLRNRQRGIIGSKDVTEGRHGLFKTYVRTDEPTGTRSSARSAADS